MSSSGKGSKPRPLAVGLGKFGENFESIFSPRKAGEAPPVQNLDTGGVVVPDCGREPLADVEQDEKGPER